MGYRHYLYIIPKKKVQQLQGKTYDELWEQFASKSEKQSYKRMVEKYPNEKKYLSIHDLGQKEIFGFGKLYWDNTAERIYNTGRPLFDDPKVMAEFDDYKPYIVTKEALKIAIEIYKDKVVEYYKSRFKENEQLCDPFFHIPIEEISKSVQEKCVEDCQTQLMEWTKDWLLDLDDTNPYRLTGSWLYQYSIFNLVHLYKIIDFNKYDLLFYGY